MRCRKLRAAALADVDLGQGEDRRLGGENHVAAGGEHAACPERRALHRGDDRLGAVEDAEERRRGSAGSRAA